MNWLAHALLSENTTVFRLGNLMPDFLSATELNLLDPVFQPGVACHRRIDAFTDQHPVVRRSVRRFATHRRVAPVLVDVFFDHFLSVDWAQHSPQPLESFIAEVYEAFDVHRAQLPESLWLPLQRMRAEDWLGSYRDFGGLRQTLTRMERRFRRRVDLVGGLVELERNYAALHEDFREFFPELRAAVVTGWLNPDNPSSERASL
jgi:acyl carrier protein phosphodiesterase